MADKDNWDSFFEDEEPKKSIDDDWGSINTGDFEDIPVADSVKAPASNDFTDVTLAVDEEPLSNDEQPYEDAIISDDEFKDDFDDVFDDTDDFEDVREDRSQRLKKDKSSGSKSPLMIVLIAVIAVGLIAAAVVLIVKAASCGGTSFKENSPSEVVELVDKYYDARIQQDTYTLKEVLPSNITISEDELKSEASIIEGYQDITIYTTNGVKDGEYVVFVSFSVKFKNIETPAPGFVDAYAELDSDGNLKFVPHEYISTLSSDVQTCISNASESDTIKALVEETNTKYEEALNSDAALKSYVESKFGTTTTSSDSSSETTAASSETTTAAETSASADTSELKAEDASTFTTCDEIWYASDDVRMREQPNTEDSTSYTNVSKGTEVQVIAKGTQWAKVINLSDGSEGYIALRYLTANKPN